MDKESYRLMDEEIGQMLSEFSRLVWEVSLKYGLKRIICGINYIEAEKGSKYFNDGIAANPVIDNILSLEMRKRLMRETAKKWDMCADNDGNMNFTITPQ